MSDALKQQELIVFFKKKPIVTTQELLDFYRQFNPDLPINTLRWRIHELKQRETIYSPKRGTYALNEKKTFQHSPNQKMSELAQLLQEKFPYVRFSIYPTQWIGNLTDHLYQTTNLIVEIDADVLDAAFYFLKEQYPNTFLSPDQKMYDFYISPKQENIIINRLLVDAPLNKVQENFYTPKLEKLLVDIVINDPVILPIGNAEIETIVSNAIDTYNINHSTLTRYANKRNVSRKINQLLPIEGEGKK